MFNMFKARRQSAIGIGIFLIFFGLIFAAAGAFFYMEGSYQPEGWKKISGKVVSLSESRDSDGDITYTPTVQYEVDNTAYTTRSSISSSSRPAIGSAVPVVYNPDVPSEAKVLLDSIFSLIFVGVGLLIMGSGIFIFIKAVQRASSIKRLMREEYKVTGVLAGVNNGGGRSGTVTISVAAVDHSGVSRVFESDQLSGIGALAMADYQKTPIPIDVYVNPSSPEEYYVDIADIPGLTPERIKDLLAQTKAGRASSNDTHPPILK